MEEKEGSSSKQFTEASDKPGPSVPASMVGSPAGAVTDLNAAKAAAMKAAEFGICDNTFFN